MERRDSSLAWISGLAVGAAAMYFFDPRSGRRRRAVARDQLLHALHAAEGSVERLAHDAGNRARGTAARTRRLVPAEPPADQRLAARARSALGRLTSHPGAITVE